LFKTLILNLYQVAKSNKEVKSGGRAPFPTCEAFNLEGLSANSHHLSGKEGGLAPALLWLISTPFCFAIRYYFQSVPAIKQATTGVNNQT
jgi:hypothetical protein